jgi:hypothetical protein
MLTATTTRPQRVLLWLAPALITIAMLGFAAAAASDPRAPGPIWILGVLVVAVGWWSYVSIPRRIAVNGSDLLLERPIGSITVPIAEVRKIDARAWNRGFVIVTAENRKIHLLRSTRNLFAIVNEIKQQNPSAMVVGDVPRVAEQAA